MPKAWLPSRTKNYTVWIGLCFKNITVFFDVDKEQHR